MDKNVMFVLAEMAEEIQNEFGCSRCKYNSIKGCKASIYAKELYDENFIYSKACLEGIINNYNHVGDMIELKLDWKNKKDGSSDKCKI